MLRIRCEGRGAAWSFTVAGELDLANCETLVSQITKAETAGAKTFELDLTDLEFIDSTGIALIVALHQRLNTERECFRLIVAPSGPVRRVLTITGLDASLPFAQRNGHVAA
jgi:anti-anti-sigma factor